MDHGTEESSGRIRFQRVSCGRRLRIAFRFSGRIGSELGDGEPRLVRGLGLTRAIMSGMEPSDPSEIDYRFSLANERTFLAWIRTALALVAGGVAAAKALEFNHDLWRWVIAAPPIVAGALLALDARARWRRYEEAMRAGRPLPAGRGIRIAGAALAVYAVVALLVAALDG